MEVGLLREGLRCMFFLALVVCFAMGFFLSTQPVYRAESRWYLDKRLELGRMREVMDPESLFSAIMHVSSRVREVVPTSSQYVDEPLKKVPLMGLMPDTTDDPNRLWTPLWNTM